MAVLSPEHLAGNAHDRILEQAIASAKAGHRSHAEGLFRRFLVGQPKHARALNQFGILLAQIGDMRRPSVISARRSAWARVQARHFTTTEPY